MLFKCLNNYHGSPSWICRNNTVCVSIEIQRLTSSHSHRGLCIPSDFGTYHTCHQLWKSRSWDSWEKGILWPSTEVCVVGISEFPRVIFPQCYGERAVRSSPLSRWIKRLRLWHCRVGLQLTALQPYGDRWKNHRKLLHQYLNVRNLDKHKELQTNEARKLVQRILKNPDNIFKEIKRSGFYRYLGIQ